MVPVTSSERTAKLLHGVLRKSNGLLEGVMVSYQSLSIRLESTNRERRFHISSPKTPLGYMEQMRRQSPVEI